VGARLLYLLLRARGLFLSPAANHAPNIPVNYFLTGSLVPEIVLLYKAHELTEKDEADFRSVLPHLTPSRKAWLLGALDETTPDHPWTRRLRG
jgi:hypothetical protein